MLRKAFAIVVMLATTAAPAFASMTVKEFRKLKKDDQTTYIMAAVSMLAYTYAAEGKPAKGRCIQAWYYGEPGKETLGPHAVAVELAIAEESDAARFTVEGVILGITDKVCDSPPGKPAPENEKKK